MSNVFPSEKSRTTTASGTFAKVRPPLFTSIWPKYSPAAASACANTVIHAPWVEAGLTRIGDGGNNGSGNHRSPDGNA